MINVSLYKLCGQVDGYLNIRVFKLEQIKESATFKLID